MLNQRTDKVELLRIANAVALEKSIDKEVILTSMESAIQKAAKTKFGSENDIRAKIDRESGDISLHKVLTIVEKPENFNNEISLESAKKIKNDSIELISKHGFYEYFDPRKNRAGLKKTGYGGDNFSWTAALYIDLINDKI